MMRWLVNSDGMRLPLRSDPFSMPEPFLENTQSQMYVEVYSDPGDGHKMLRYADWDKSPDGQRGKVTIQVQGL